MDREQLVEKMAERLVLRRFPKVENIVRWKRNNKIEWGEIWEDARAINDHSVGAVFAEVFETQAKRFREHAEAIRNTGGTP